VVIGLCSGRSLVVQRAAFFVAQKPPAFVILLSSNTIAFSLLLVLVADNPVSLSVATHRLLMPLSPSNIIATFQSPVGIRFSGIYYPVPADLPRRFESAALCFLLHGFSGLAMQGRIFRQTD
jgi:hypothetical protein